MILMTDTALQVSQFVGVGKPISMGTGYVWVGGYWVNFVQVDYIPPKVMNKS